jgi:hypothetical protein
MAHKTPVVLTDEGRKHDILPDGETLSPASIPVSASTTNALVAKDDGLYVAKGATGGGEPGADGVGIAAITVTTEIIDLPVSET